MADFISNYGKRKENKVFTFIDTVRKRYIKRGKKT